MSWLRSTRNSGVGGGLGNSNSSFFPSSTINTLTPSNVITGFRQRPIDTATNCDPRACYDSFCKHWQQAYDIIQRSGSPLKPPPTHDDVLGVVSHLDFMVTLLLVELHHCNKIQLPMADSAPPAPCLEYMLSENLLDKLYEWGSMTGRYANAVRLEQLKLYELLVSHSRHQLLCHEPFLRPLLKILASSQGEIFPPDLERRLVILLNQLCVVLMQNVHLLDLFFFSAAQEQHKLATENEYQKNSPTTNFIIFSLLIPYVHREGSLGHQARDALLLCMALSQKNSNIGIYIAQYSSMCPLLVTGLGGLYSRLPNSIEITTIDWHRITPDDVTEIPELTLFMNALEFCNAVVQVAHEMIKNQLLDFMYHGFIVPVLGPAILQTLNGKQFQSNMDSQISAMSYLDLILRSVTEPGLLRCFIKFLLDPDKFDGERLLDTLVERLTSSDSNICMVTMSLFDTLLGLHCEDLMLELLLKYVLPGKHIPISHRHKINKIDPYTNVAEFFFELTPDVMKHAYELTKHKYLGDTVTNNAQTHNQYPKLPSPTSTMSKTIGANWNYYGLHTGDSLYSSVHAYLFEAHFRIIQCKRACSKWANTYKYQKWPLKSFRPNTHALDMVKQFFREFNVNQGFVNFNCENSKQYSDDGEKRQLDSLQSIGESSGYESFIWRPADEDVQSEQIIDSTFSVQNTTKTITHFSGQVDEINLDENKVQIKKEPWRTSNNRNELILTDFDFSEDLFAQGSVSLGPFLNAIWSKLQTFTSNTLYVNLHLTGLITRLAWYPLPLIHSIFLRPDIIITSDTPSFHQVLRILKQQIDAELPVVENSLEIIDIARSYLIDREFRLINIRRTIDSTTSSYTAKSTTQQQRINQQTTYANISASSPIQVTPSSSYDPFKRGDAKRRSLSKSITSMFSRTKPNGSSSSASYISGNNNVLSPSSNAHANTKTTDHLLETSLSNMPSKNGSSSISGEVGTTATLNTSEINSLQPPNLRTQTTSHPPSLTTLSNYNVGQISVSTVNSLSSVLNSAGSSGGNSEPVSLDSLSSMGVIVNTSGTERKRDLALCAVLFDEWLKELAAIAQEQSIVLLQSNNF